MIHGLSIHLLATQLAVSVYPISDFNLFFLMGEAKDGMEAYEPYEAQCFVFLTAFQCIQSYIREKFLEQEEEYYDGDAEPPKAWGAHSLFFTYS